MLRLVTEDDQGQVAENEVEDLMRDAMVACNRAYAAMATRELRNSNEASAYRLLGCAASAIELALLRSRGTCGL